MGPKQYRPYAPRQNFLLPPSMLDWLPPGHLAYFLLDLVEQLDLSGITRAIHAKDPRGNRPYDPKMMVALLLYAWCVGVRSSRKIAKLTWIDLGFRVVAGDNHPVFSTLATFRRGHAAALEGLFQQVLEIAQKAGLVVLNHVAVDGTKVQAAASKHKAMSHGRMKLTKEKLEEEVKRIMAEAEETDRREDEEFGEDSDGSEVTEELARRETRIAKIKQAMAELEEEARKGRAQDLREQAERHREKAESADSPTDRKRSATLAKKRQEAAEALGPPDDDDDDSTPPFETPEGLPMNRPPAKPDGTPKPKAQRNFTDPDSRIMEKGGTFLQGYNCQAAVDEAHQIIVAQAVTNQSPDAGNLEPMVRLVKNNCGTAPETVTADTGYWTAGVEEGCGELGADVYVATKRTKHGEEPASTSEDPPPDDASAKDRMRAKLNTANGREIYRKRKKVVEPVFGQIKDARGLIRFLRRGLDAARQDWNLDCTSHNIMKLFRAGWSPATSPG